ncbi:MAG: peptidase [Bacillales bacterium]|nr:peptidase [Bacillales bacterium]
MEKYILPNKLKLIYEKNNSKLTSICISIDAGASKESTKLGIAHATEHMLYKGTKKRTEKKINEELSGIFGMQNAMTNYPYVIYYGTLLDEDVEHGLELFSDILLNPIFPEEGFKEEMSVISEELKEWDDDLEQFCEDKLFFNAYSTSRLKHPIIGTKDSLESISLEDIKRFYYDFYVPENTTIAIVSNLDFERVKSIVLNLFNGWDNQDTTPLVTHYETPQGYFVEEKAGINSSKVQMIFPIHELDFPQLKALRIFNEIFGEGVNSALYEALRTENGLVYDIKTKIAYEKGIKLFKIIFSTSENNVEQAIMLINNCIEKIPNIIEINDFKQTFKSFKLKRLVREEKGIILAKELSTYDTMFGDGSIYLDEIESLEEISKDFVEEVALKVLRNPSVQVINPRS